MSIKHSLKNAAPRTWQFARTARQTMRLIPRIFGYLPRECNLCGYSGRFLAEIHFPDIFAFDAVCPNCSSQPRARLAWLNIAQHGLIGKDDDVLHFAPEGPLRARLPALARSYRTADINPAGVDLALNIENLALPDASVDVVYCSHVLEHVDHDKALRELFRVCRSGGRLLVLIPIVEGWDANYENPGVVGDKDRAIHFGKENHLRRFGRSVRGSFADAGFALSEYSASGEDTVRLGLVPGEILFVGRKP